MKCKYNVITSKGHLEAWSGEFDSEQEAKEWYEKHGKKQGKNLVLIRVAEPGYKPIVRSKKIKGPNSTKEPAPEKNLF